VETRRSSFPKTLLEFQTRFATDEACEAYLAECRWPDGFRCPSCGGERSWALPARRLRECAACGHQTSTTAGTVLHRTRLPLRVWFWAAYLMVVDSRGVSARGLQRQLGISRYETAWMLLHKLRRATVNLNRGMLSGTVEVDEAWFGGKQAGGSGRKREGRRAALVVLALEVRDGHPERLRTRLVPDDTAASLVGFVRDVVEPGSTVVTDGWPSYLPLAAAGYEHVRVVEGDGAAFVNAVPNLHQTIGNLKTWLGGTHRFVSRLHLAVYLDGVRVPAQPAAQPPGGVPDPARDGRESRTDRVEDHRGREGPAEGGVHALAGDEAAAEGRERSAARAVHPEHLGLTDRAGPDDRAGEAHASRVAELRQARGPAPVNLRAVRVPPRDRRVEAV
jgi:hypothetical protein